MIRNARNGRRRAGLVMLATAGALAGVVATNAPAAAAPAPTGPTMSLFAEERGAAIDAARFRLRSSIAEGRADLDRCDVASADTVRAAVGSAGITDVQLDPWTQSSAIDGNLRPGDGERATVFQTVLRCDSVRPDSDTAVRPTVFAVVVDPGLDLSSNAGRPLARMLDVEPIVALSSSSLGGETVGSCQSTLTVGVCSVLWSDDGLALGVTLEGAPGALTPQNAGAVLDATVPAVVDSLAVRRLTPSPCTVEQIAADTGVTVVGDLACADGFAAGPIVECAPSGCGELDVFHITAGGWVRDGATTSICPEDVAQYGPTAVTAAELVGPFTPPPPPPVDPNATSTTTTTTLVPPPPPCNPDADALNSRRLDSGDEGPRVVAAQAALVALGYDIPVDARFGPLTTAAVLDFQLGRSLSVDGVVGSQTREAMGI